MIEKKKYFEKSAKLRKEYTKVLDENQILKKVVNE